MKILLINGSPKREQSDTMRLTRAFLDGMRDVLPVGVQTICPIDRAIEPCRGASPVCAAAAVSVRTI